MAFLWHLKYCINTHNHKQIIHMHTCTRSNKNTNTHSCNSQMPFVCSLIICETLWVSVNTFYGSTGTEALSSLSKWFYKQFSEAWCLLTWNPLPLSLTYYHWYNLFSGNCGTDQRFPWLIVLLRLNMGSYSAKRVSHPCVRALDMVLQKTSRNSYIRKIQIKAQFHCDSSFLQIFLLHAE